MRRSRSERRSHSLGNIDQWIDQYRILHQRYRAQPLPRIVRAPEENHRRQNDSKHQTDLLRLDRSAKKKSERRERRGAKYSDQQHVAKVREAEIGNGTHDESRHRQYEQRRDYPLQHSRDDFLSGY